MGIPLLTGTSGNSLVAGGALYLQQNQLTVKLLYGSLINSSTSFGNLKPQLKISHQN
jgi:hypothetical protein